MLKNPTKKELEAYDFAEKPKPRPRAILGDYLLLDDSNIIAVGTLKTDGYQEVVIPRHYLMKAIELVTTGLVRIKVRNNYPIYIAAHSQNVDSTAGVIIAPTIPNSPPFMGDLSSVE